MLTAALCSQPAASDETSLAEVAQHRPTAKGSHLIVDLYDASGLDDAEAIRRCLLVCVKRAGATLLHVHVHRFGDGNGVSAVAVLAESHLSIHTWPDERYAAVDAFMCGDAVPSSCIDVLLRAFRPTRLIAQEVPRG